MYYLPPILLNGFIMSALDFKKELCREYYTSEGAVERGYSRKGWGFVGSKTPLNETAEALGISRGVSSFEDALGLSRGDFREALLYVMTHHRCDSRYNLRRSGWMKFDIHCGPQDEGIRVLPKIGCSLEDCRSGLMITERDYRRDGSGRGHPTTLTAVFPETDVRKKIQILFGSEGFSADLQDMALEVSKTNDSRVSQAWEISRSGNVERPGDTDVCFKNAIRETLPESLRVELLKRISCVTDAVRDWKKSE